ncbi:transmembrane protein 272-like [Mugil cephalus]|uniref:transmembrane protein 272-like n=1 Tax=Mugil cephalus TaxID=48193 RepID=UPI001FB60B74|nr:transmembrane protein 272-like [Mugil cephalus]
MSPETESRSQSAEVIATTVVVNIIWWMVMIAAIVLGVVYLRQCPVQHLIPIYLLVMGASSIGSLCVTYIRTALQDSACFLLITIFMSLLHIFNLFWFVAGTYWVYSVYPPDYSPHTVRYCHKTTYLFAFIVNTIMWGAIALMFVCGCCGYLLICCGALNARPNLIPIRRSFYGTIGDHQESAGGDV